MGDTASRLAQLEKTDADKSAQIRTLHEQQQQFQQDFLALKRENSAFLKEIYNIRQETTSLKETVSDLDQRMSAMANHTISSLRQDIEKAVTGIGVVRRDVQAMSTRTQKISGPGDNSTPTREEVQNVFAEVENVKADLKTLMSQTKKIQKETTKALTDIEIIHRNVQTLTLKTEKMTDLEERLTSVENQQIPFIKERIEKQASEIRLVEEGVHAIRNEIIPGLDQTVETIRAQEIPSLKNDISKTDDEIGVIKKDVQIINSEIGQLDKRTFSIENILDNMGQSVTWATVESSTPNMGRVVTFDKCAKALLGTTGGMIDAQSGTLDVKFDGKFCVGVKFRQYNNGEIEMSLKWDGVEGRGKAYMGKTGGKNDVCCSSTVMCLRRGDKLGLEAIRTSGGALIASCNFFCWLLSP